MAHDVFVSYSQHDKLVADAIVGRLEQAGTRCWIAPRDITPGTSWGEAIVQAIDASRVMVLVLSGESNKSRQVVREVERAVAGDVSILPFRIENIDPTGAMAYFLGTEHWLDAVTPPVERHIDRLAVTVATLVSGDPVPRDQLDTPPPAVARKARPRWLPAALIGGALAVAAIVLGVVLSGGDSASPTTLEAITTTTTPPTTTAAPTTTTSTTTTTTTTIPVGLTEAGRFKPFDLDPSDLRAPDAVYGFDTEGTMAAIANGIDGVTRISIGSPADLRAVDTFGVNGAQDVAFDGEYIYALTGDFVPEVIVFPVDGSGGEWVTWGPGGRPSISHISGADGYAYLSGHDFVGIVDATNPGNPELIFEWEPPGSTGNPANAFVAGDVGYFSAGWDGLYIFDLTDRSAPALLGHWASPNWVVGVVVVDEIAYVTLGETGMATLDVGDPAGPRMLGLVELTGFTSRIDVAFGHAFISWFGDNGGLGGIAVVDVRDPENPEFVETFGRFQSISGLQVSGGHLFITDEAEGLISFEITGLD